MRFELAPFALPAGYGESVLPLAAAKAQVAIEETEAEFDLLLEAFRDGAVDMVERYCGVYLAPREGVIWRAECLPTRLRLGVGPVTAITGISGLSSSGDVVRGDPATLRLAAGGEVVLKPGSSWPTGLDLGIQVEFTAGYTDETRPSGLVQAVTQFTAHLFRFRDEAGETGQIAGDIPAHVRALCARYRSVVI